MEDCIFCNVVSGTVPSVKIWEDRHYFAFLDLYPNTRGQSLVIPKKHVQSYLFDLEPGEIRDVMNAAGKVSRLLEKGLGVLRVNLVFEGLEINHLHAKLYPVYGLKGKFESIHTKDTVSFGDYPGYVSTLHGPRADLEELRKVALQING
jgi:diadenosine tetraphosphate (Ap4A) HIT family hydrolase